MGLFLPENVAQGVISANFEAGIDDVDNINVPEADVESPWLIDKDVSWLDGEWWTETTLDSGMVVHKLLPQSAQNADTLSSGDIDASGFSIKTDGINFKSAGNFTDIVQRMATSTYRICLKGWARRAGYQVPIPGLRTRGGVLLVPDDDLPQKVVGPCIIANNYGIPVWYARWELWYTLATPPVKAQIPPPNFAQHISATTDLLKGIQVPITAPDAQSVRSGPDLTNPIRRGGQ
jgi:hypothetical protein